MDVLFNDLIFSTILPHCFIYMKKHQFYLHTRKKRFIYFIRSEKYESSVLLGNGSSCLFIFWKVLTWPFHLKVNRIYADFLLTDSYSVASCSVTSLKFIWISIETSFITILMLHVSGIQTLLGDTFTYVFYVSTDIICELMNIWFISLCR